MKSLIGKLLRKVVFAFGIIYGIDLVLTGANIYIPINVSTVGITTLLGVPGLLAIFSLLILLK